MDASNFMQRLAQYVNAQSRLESMGDVELVELALTQMPEEIDGAYEQVIEELCRRVDPDWARRTESPSTIP